MDRRPTDLDVVEAKPNWINAFRISNEDNTGPSQSRIAAVLCGRAAVG